MAWWPAAGDVTGSVAPGPRSGVPHPGSGAAEDRRGRPPPPPARAGGARPLEVGGQAPARSPAAAAAAGAAGRAPRSRWSTAGRPAGTPYATRAPAAEGRPGPRHSCVPPPPRVWVGGARRLAAWPVAALTRFGPGSPRSVMEMMLCGAGVSFLRVQGPGCSRFGRGRAGGGATWPWCPCAGSGDLSSGSGGTAAVRALAAVSSTRACAVHAVWPRASRRWGCVSAGDLPLGLSSGWAERRLGTLSSCEASGRKLSSALGWASDDFPS